MKHPTFADGAFLAFLDRRLSEKFPDPAAVAGEDISQMIAESFRIWLADPATRTTHHPIELRELQELMAIEWGIAPDDARRFISPQEFAARFRAEADGSTRRDDPGAPMDHRIAGRH
jgi:hypothetical protein